MKVKSMLAVRASISFPPALYETTRRYCEVKKGVAGFDCAGRGG